MPTGYTRLQVTRLLTGGFCCVSKQLDQRQRGRCHEWATQSPVARLRPQPSAVSAALSPRPTSLHHPLPCILLTSRAAIFLPAEARTRSNFMAAAQGTLCRLGVGPTPTGDQLVGRNSRMMVSKSRGHSRTCGGTGRKGGREGEGQDQAQLGFLPVPSSFSPLWLIPGNAGPGERARPGYPGLQKVLGRSPPERSAAEAAG